ncbi:MAG: alpha/beta hydrolase, partial [Candidatus Udaeobacter sp.]
TGDVDILWAGGAWQDDAIPLWNTFWRPSGKTPTINDHEMMPEEVTNFYLDARHILVLGSYPLGNIERAIASQRALTDYVYRHCSEWGGDKTKIVLSGHSAGGHGAVVSALWHEGPRIKAVVGMADVYVLIKNGSIRRSAIRSNNRGEVLTVGAPIRRITWCGIAKIAKRSIWYTADKTIKYR